MAKSRKAFAYEHTQDVPKLRTLRPTTDAKYDPKEHFMWHEESDYLADALQGTPYATWKTNKQEDMQSLLMNGYDDQRGTTWRALFAYWKDQEGHAVIVPDSSPFKDLRDIGINTFMKSPADFMKVGKYTNRLLAALPKPMPTLDAKTGELTFRGFGIWGDEIGWSEDFQTGAVKLDLVGSDLTAADKTLSIRYMNLDNMTKEQKALVDGCIVVSDRAVRALNLSNNPKLGMAWRGTFGTQRGLGKGHILYKNNMEVDIVIYGPKTILKTNRFFFGSMGPLHAGIPHTDWQSTVNFHYHRPGLLVDLAKAFMKEILESSKDEQSMRKLLLRYTGSTEHKDLDQEGWILRRALAYGVSFLRFPGLYRRAIRYLMTKVMVIDERARVPMTNVAKYGYVLPDPNVIDSQGDVHPENGIPEGHIVFPDVDPGTKVVCYRQPSENTNAWVPLNVLYRPEYKAFANRGICLLGRGADKVLGRLGGGDMDDSFVIVHDPKWVEAFHTMRPYPETDKISADEEDDQTPEQTELARIEDELLEGIRDTNYTHYTNKHVAWQMEMAKNARAGIGPVVNYGMIDMLLSDPEQKQSMLADLANNPEAYAWLEDRDPYQAALFMTNLELVIDGNVKDNTLLRKLGDVAGTIKKFHQECVVYPASLTSRIPMKRIEKGDFTVARSMTCRAIDMIRMIRDRLQDIFNEREWAIVAPADVALRDEYRMEREIELRVGRTWDQPDGKLLRKVGNRWSPIKPGTPPSIMDIWAEEWVAELSQAKAHDKAYGNIVKTIADELYGEDDETMEKLAVALYYQTYKGYQPNPKVDQATGRIRGFADGLLWSPVFGNHFINALRKARLSGFYGPADIYPQFRNRLLDAVVAVETRNHLVYVQDSDGAYTVEVGIVYGKCPDTRAKMDGGLIEFRPPQEICQPADPDLIAQKPLTRLYPPKGEETKALTAEEPKGTMAKLLVKAKDILGMK